MFGNTEYTAVHQNLAKFVQNLNALLILTEAIIFISYTKTVDPGVGSYKYECP